MVSAQLNVFDSVILIIMFLSTVVAFFRGFVREVLSLFSWVGAAIITVMYFPEVSELLKPHFSSPVIATGFATLGLYICALIILSILTSLILRYVKAGNEVGVLDNVLGMLFGAARGAFIVSLGFLLVSKMMSADNYPDWIKEARTRPFVEKGAETLAQIAPHYMSELTIAANKAKTEAGTVAQQAPTLDQVSPASGPSNSKWMNLDALTRMIKNKTEDAKEAVEEKAK